MSPIFKGSRASEHVSKPCHKGPFTLIADSAWDFSRQLLHFQRDMNASIYCRFSNRLYLVLMRHGIMCCQFHLQKGCKFWSLKWNVVEVKCRQCGVDDHGSGWLGPECSIFSTNRFAALKVAVSLLFQVVKEFRLFILVWNIEHFHQLGMFVNKIKKTLI